MSAAHSGVSFNHSCLKVPVDPQNQRPSPNYERLSTHKVIENNKRNDFHRHYDRNKRESLASPTSSLGNFKSVESYLQFYENIPDYSELHHLSDEEFYSRLKTLKMTQKRFCNGSDVLEGNDEPDTNYLSRERPSSHSSYDSRDKYTSGRKYRKNESPERNLLYKKDPETFTGSNCYSPYSAIDKNRLSPSRTGLELSVNPSAYSDKLNNESILKRDKSPVRSCMGEMSPKKKPPPQPPKINVISDSENISDLGYDEKLLADESSLKNDVFDYKQHQDFHHVERDNSMIHIWDKASTNEFMSKEDELGDGSISEDGIGLFDKKSRSLPSSPDCKSKLCDCETPKICQRLTEISLRDKDSNSNVDPMQYHVHGLHGHMCHKEKRLSGKKQKKTHARPVPLLSRIPLFDKIMAEQEARRRFIHHRYSKELQALVQPFSFTKREEEEKQRIRSSCSNPDLSSSTRQHTPFKAKPVPKNLFSTYAYERMREDDFYRALKKRIRAEEMLKSASLPPSMAAREQKYRSKSLDFLDHKAHSKKRNKCRGYKRACEVLRREIDFDLNNKENKSQKRRSKPSWLTSSSRRTNSITDSSTEASPYESISEPDRRSKMRPHSALSINRNNLASVLRIETVRKRLEREMQENLEESRLKEEARFKARLVRMTPAWRALNYSTEEDLAIRVAARREEERLRREHHQKLMGSIYGRVHQMPPLFQRQTSPNRGAKYSGKPRSRSGEKSTSKNIYKGVYCDNDSGNIGKEDENKESECDAEQKQERFCVSRSTSPIRDRNGFRSRNSSESMVSLEKSEGTKIDESDIDSVSQDDEMDEYGAQGDGEEN